ncbi:MAG: TraR/DksA family transcriptional regulator [Acidiferrobacteraceae bacterium]
MPLSRQHLAKFKDRLEHRRAELQEATRSAAQADEKNLSDIGGRVRDPGDEALAIQLADFNITSLQKDIAEFTETEAALKRIKDGVYGECEDCGGEIPIERLEAYPAARRCTRCQERLEIRTRGRDMTPTL